MENQGTTDSSQPKHVTIIVNGRPKKWEKESITFAEVVTLAFGIYEDNENIAYTVTYNKPLGNHQGSMVKGSVVDVTDGMIFNVSRTDKS